MGCDIHPYIEYVTEGFKKGETRVEHFATLYGSRDYCLFAALTNGNIRGIDGTGAVPNPKGIPDGVSLRVFDELTLYVSDRDSADGGEGTCSLSSAKEWTSENRYGYSSSEWVTGSYNFRRYDPSKDGLLVDGRPKSKDFKWVTDPDWHTHSWLTANELEAAIESYPEIMRKTWGDAYEEGSGDQPHSEVFGWLAALKALDERDGVIESRLIFWFDN